MRCTSSASRILLLSLPLLFSVHLDANQAVERADDALSIILAKDTHARGTVVCDKTLGICHTGFNAFFFLTTPDPLDIVIGGANYSINGAHWQVGESIASSEQWQSSKLGEVEGCPEGQWCQRFSWTHSATYQMTDALPIEMCFKIWALDLTHQGPTKQLEGDGGGDGRPQIAVSKSHCFFYTTPLEPHTREQVTGPATAVFISSPFSAQSPVLAYPFTLPTPAFDLPDLGDIPSFQTLCSAGGDYCRSSVHVPLLVFPSNPLDQVHVFATYALDDDLTWTPGGVPTNQGIMFEAPGLAADWSQLWTWDLTVITRTTTTTTSSPFGGPQQMAALPPRKICVRLFAMDRKTAIVAPAGQPFCHQFVDLQAEASFSGPVVPMPADMTVMVSHRRHDEGEDEDEEALDKTPFIEGIAALSGLFVAVALIATTYTTRRRQEGSADEVGMDGEEEQQTLAGQGRGGGGGGSSSRGGQRVDSLDNGPSPVVGDPAAQLLARHQYTFLDDDDGADERAATAARRF